MTKTTKTILSWTLSGVLLLGAAASIPLALSHLQSNAGSSPTMESVSGMVASENHENSNISIKKYVIPVEEFADYGVSPLAESAITLTATVTPSWATDKTMDWILGWENAASEWAAEKDAADYVTVTPTSDGALEATVSCLQAFGEPIIVTARSRANPSASATCRLDYQQKYLGTATWLSNANPSLSIDFSTTVDGGTITSDLPNTDLPWVFTSYRYRFAKSEACTIPLKGDATIRYYVKPTEDFASRLNMETTMGGYQLTPADDWALLDTVQADLSKDGAEMGWSVHLDAGSIYGIPHYLNTLCSGVSGTVNSFSDQYAGFIDAVNGINNSPDAYSDHVCFEIKIVTTIGDQSYETVTKVKLNSVTLPA